MSRPARYYDDLLAARGRDKSSTCYLFLQDVKPLSEWKVLNTIPVKKSPQEREEYRMKSSELMAIRCHERFAPHVETIKQMLEDGETYQKIGSTILMAKEVVRKYVIRNPEKFGKGYGAV